MGRIKKAARRALRHFSKLDAPGHGHRVPGRWDGDAQHPAGSVCKKCRDWNALRALIEE